MTTEGTTTIATKTTRATTAFATATKATFGAFRRLRLQARDHGHRDALIGERFNGTHFHAVTMFGKSNGFTGTARTTGTTNAVYVIFCLHG